MKPQLFTVAAGIPIGLGDRFEARFNRQPGWKVVTRKDLDLSEQYTNVYARRLYEQLAAKLKIHKPSDRKNILAHVNLILLYLTKNDGSESTLVERFGTEALIVPLRRPDTVEIPATSNRRGQAVNDLVKEAVRAVRNAQPLLGMIAEEVTNRDNKTCLLLPPKNLGQNSDTVARCVYNAVLERREVDDFKDDLKRIANSLDTDRDGKYTYFVGKQGLVFKSPGKSGARHGYAPAWGELDHDSRCVLRGRLRFGAPYDPRFHYDCEITKSMPRDFASCHGTKKLPRKCNHANIAPNDNVR